MNLGLAIKRSRMLREEAVRQVHMAEAVGISQTYLSQIEANKKEPSPRTLNKIAKYLNIPTVALHLMAMEESDVPEHKREAYKLLIPAATEFMNELLIKMPLGK